MQVKEIVVRCESVMLMVMMACYSPVLLSAVLGLQLLVLSEGPVAVLLGNLLIRVVLLVEALLGEQLVAFHLAKWTQVNALHNESLGVKQQQVGVGARLGLELNIMEQRNVFVDELLHRRKTVQTSSGAALYPSTGNCLVGDIVFT